VLPWVLEGLAVYIVVNHLLRREENHGGGRSWQFVVVVVDSSVPGVTGRSGNGTLKERQQFISI
jgi:hypothetical protein